MITKNMLGLYKSPIDLRDVLIKSFLKEIDLPNKFSRREEMTPIRNQGQEGSCAGFAGAGIKEWQETIDTGEFMVFSPRYIYEYAKKISGHSNGTTLKAIFQVLFGRGICYEKDWPYMAGNVSFKSKQADENAGKYKVIGYARITNLDELKRAIYNGYPNGGAILCGLKLYKGAIGKQAQETGITPDPTCFQRPIGGHALIGCEWDDNSPHYKDGHICFKGSWDNAFGNAGYHYFSYKNVEKNMMDAMAMVDITGSPAEVVGSIPISKRESLWI